MLDFFAAFVRPVGNTIAIADLVELMGMMDVDEQAVRSSVSRLKRRGWLDSTKVNGRVGYRISDSSLAELREGDERVFHLEPADLADGWCIVTFSIPESRRSKRHKLRSKLTWWGFGNVIPGVWIAPQRARVYALRIIAELGLEHDASVFDAKYSSSIPLAEFVQGAWDFAAISVRYGAFVDKYADRADRLRASPAPPDGQQAFVEYLGMLNEWRSIPFLDPGLPLEVLPDNWQGLEATRLFHDVSSVLLEPALEFVRTVVGVTSLAPLPPGQLRAPLENKHT
jgi:phenylacetic acid degradation operon negative regulatory protein